MISGDEDMTRFLMKVFLKDADLNTARGRELCGRLAGIVGIICNVILCIMKMVVGTITASIAITADGINNLSDAGSSIITLIGFRISGKAADNDHPFGHARMEYVTALIVSIIILLIGFNLGQSSIEKIFSPENTQFSTVSFLILGVSILIKFWMMLFNAKLGKTINSTALEATSADSRNDAIATLAVLIAAVISKFTSLNLDGYMGALVAAFIIYSGVGLIKETIGPLLGQAPDPKIVKELKQRILSYEGVLGVHDFMVHCYGPGIYYASAHIEMDANSNMLSCHDVLDSIENDVRKQMKIQLVLHLDPLVTDDEETNVLKEKVNRIVRDLDVDLSIHDFRVVTGMKAKNVVFDVLVPRDFKMTDVEVREYLEKKISQEIEGKVGTVITIDHGFVTE
jgi:cation diffusion facilitator family transporter